MRDTRAMELSEIVGFLAGLGTTFAAFPDLLAMLKRRSSLGMNSEVQVLWIYYGLLIASRPVIIWNVIATVRRSHLQFRTHHQHRCHHFDEKSNFCFCTTPTRWNNWHYTGLANFLQSSVQGIQLQETFAGGIRRNIVNSGGTLFSVYGGFAWQELNYQQTDITDIENYARVGGIGRGALPTIRQTRSRSGYEI